jgi:uncharacterized membrane protein
MYSYNPTLTSFLAPRLAAWYCLAAPITACAIVSYVAAQGEVEGCEGCVGLGVSAAVGMLAMVAFRRSSSSLVPLLWVAWVAGAG